MKQLLVILVTLGLAASASAQSKVRGRVVAPRGTTRVIVATPVYPAWVYGLGYGYNSRFSPFYDPFYRPFNDPFYRSRVIRQEVTPSELQLELDQVENDYDHKLALVKDDESLSGKERRQKIRDIKYQKEDALINAKRSFLNKQRQQKEKGIE